MAWNKKYKSSGTTPSFRELVESAKKFACAAGSQDLPICVVPAAARESLAQSLRQIYAGSIGDELSTWVAGGQGRHLAISWIRGFKPKGDDARPDRGVEPLARMLLGSEVDQLAVVFGPAPAQAWSRLVETPESLAAANGLWESILKLADAVLGDSTTSDGPIFSLVADDASASGNPPSVSEPAQVSTKSTEAVTEHVVDTVLHLLLGRGDPSSCFEGLCNPPGGDWSGVMYKPFDEDVTVRWTSLPRVSGADSKRPDHIAFMRDGARCVAISIESKSLAGDVETGIGPRLQKYLADLMGHPPNVANVDGEWLPYDAVSPVALPDLTETVSGIAFAYQDEASLRETLERSGADLCIGVQTDSNQSTLLHLISSPSTQWLVGALAELAQSFAGWLEIREH